jgi:hypothetical protein
MKYTTNSISDFQAMLNQAVIDGLLFNAYSDGTDYVIEYTGGH